MQTLVSRANVLRRRKQHDSHPVSLYSFPRQEGFLEVKAEAEAEAEGVIFSPRVFGGCQDEHLALRRARRAQKGITQKGRKVQYR